MQASLQNIRLDFFSFDLSPPSLTLFSVKTIGSYLIILLLISAYGRCLADQMGMLNNSASACCQVSCFDSDLSELEPHNDHPGQQEDNKKPPCQLCIILDSDSLLLQDGLEIPSLSPYSVDILWDNHFAQELRFIHTPQPSVELTSHGFEETVQEQRSLQLRTAAKALPVRGPSLIICDHFLIRI